MSDRILLQQAFDAMSYGSAAEREAARIALLDRLEQPEHHKLQAKGEHPAPCARHCEATAFQIVIKNLKAQLAQPEQEPAARLTCEELGYVPLSADGKNVYIDGVGLVRLAQPEQDDPCPGCRKGVVCRTPTCGRLKLPVDHPHRSEQPEQEPFVVWNELMARECKQEGLQALSHEQFVRWYADKLKAAHGIKE